MKYRPDIDGLRAVAVVSVMLYHVNARWLPGGFVGVDVFFVISGFVVSASLAESSRRRIGGFIAEFYARRLARIVPALIVMLVCAALAATLVIPRAWLSRFSEQTALYAFLGLSNWAMQHNADAYFAPLAKFNPYTHTWSLGVEEQFYLVCPFLLFLWVRGRARANEKSSALARQMLALLGVASLVACGWATRAQPTAAFYSVLFRFWELAAGALLFERSASHSEGAARSLEHADAFGAWAGLGIVGASMIFTREPRFPFPWAVAVVLGTAMLLGGVHASTAHPLRRLLAHPIAVWIGRRSYSLYLWHWPVFVLTRWTVGFESVLPRALAVGAAFAAATVSYRWVEMPLRHSPRLERHRPAAGIVFFLALIVVTRTGVRLMFSHGPAISLSAVTRNYIDWYPDTFMPFPNDEKRICHVITSVRQLADGELFSYRPTTCRGIPDQRTMFVIGDSHAREYLPMVEELSAERGLDAKVYFRAGCPYLDLLRPMAEGKPGGCAAFVQAAARDVLGAGRPGDILFLPSLRQFRLEADDGTIVAQNFDSLMRSPMERERMSIATAEAVTMLRPFAEKDMAILFAAPTPLFRSSAFRCSDWFNASNPACRGGLTEPRAYLERLRGPIISAMQSISVQLPEVRVWDPFTVLCPAEPCTVTRDGRPTFFDGDHLSAYGDAVVYPSFANAVDSMRAVGPN